MYANSETSVCAPVGDTDFLVEVGLHQGSVLSLFLFAVVLDELSKSIQDIFPWCMLFVYDIVLIAESKQDLNMSLQEWRAALESKGLKISQSKTEYLDCDFCGVNDDEDVQITIESQEVAQSTKFKYLGSFVQSDGGTDSDVAHRVQAGWCKWRATTGVLCDKRFPTKLKGKFYTVAIRTVMLYGTDCWAIKKTHMRKLEVVEMRMLRGSSDRLMERESTARFFRSPEKRGKGCGGVGLRGAEMVVMQCEVVAGGVWRRRILAGAIPVAGKRLKVAATVV
ncbi:uncharacterized protein LOC143576971 [Bidens hawaiensis]|uniref:uncharacterized protein LOC143576971 n=1 Tax=Bidens hawaiensis TaxID=980011 RepID=UPI00404B6214